jgi:hypothetical protein
MPVDKAVIAKALRSATRDLDEPRRKLAGRAAVTTELDTRTLRAARRLAAERNVPLSEVIGVAVRLTLSDDRLARRLARALAGAPSPEPGGSAARKGKVTPRR